MDRKTLENIIQISIEFGTVIKSKALTLPGDFAATAHLTDHILEWSEEFERGHEENGEYLCDIAAFAHKKFCECGWSESPKTKILYLYRDASNYKVQNSCIINGLLSMRQIEQIRNCCQDREYFIPAEVGLPEEGFSTYMEDDHPFFELVDFEEVFKGAEVQVTPDEIVRAFEECKDKWDELGVMKEIAEE
uniref:hypothetical protein n=1 Tax=Lachnoclostridium phocaeense TaxID=1871021 RepID=UPI0026DBFA74|nr:hypothetical protein [Lachnoclostridium phocaeense]